jgi:thioredoxin-like negative regulator of GroEL
MLDARSNRATQGRRRSRRIFAASGFANPENPALIVLLAQTQARAGRFDEASKVLQTASARVAESDRVPPEICKSRSAICWRRLNAPTKPLPHIKNL